MIGLYKFVFGYVAASIVFADVLAAQAPSVRPAQPVQPAPAIRAEAVTNPPADVIRDSRQPAPAPAQAPAISAAAGDYVLSVSDTLEMTIFREGDLSTRSRIGSDGTVQLPLIGDVKVAGMTVRAARELIRKRYDADYLVDPQVYLNVIDYAQRGFTILGQVTKPGTYEFPGGKSLSLLQAVGMAGGFTRTADRGKVIVKRAPDGAAPQTIRLNAKKLAGDGKDSFAVEPGDVITVGESWF
jgi:polysaccharide export outer membrane protein